ncbi:MAG: threonine--tRNA ligase [Candidatus Dojkabacteria bacterium]
MGKDSKQDNQNINREENEQDKLFAMRHSAEHVFMQAMERVFGIDKFLMAMGPATESGFYFDFEPLGDFKLSEDDLPKLESEIEKIKQEEQKFVRKEIEVTQAQKLFKENPYKQEWLDEIEEKGQVATIYENVSKEGEVVFVDLCKGPHVDSTSELGAIKLLNIAGAYWRVDENNKMLTRVYGTAFFSQAELDQHLENLEKARENDHRRLGKQLDLFFISEKVGGGLNIWTPRGTVLREQLDKFVWELRKEKGYEKVSVPHITKKDLYETSGHWDKFADELFRMETREGHEFALKPMNCPHHTQIYANRKRSYRELPQRYAETTAVYRDEQSGELSGLSRVRAITQDDAHVFCRMSQVEQEFNAIWDIIERFYAAFDMSLKMRLSFHEPTEMDKYLGDSESWQKSEQLLEQMAKKRGGEYFVAKGEAAMYGPKTDFMGVDSMGREHQVATVQLDMHMPERFGLVCINEQGEEERVVMIHAAVMGSIERFLSVLIEHLGGNFPAWLAPEAVRILPISDDQLEYAKEVQQALQQAAFEKHTEARVSIDSSNDRLQGKIKAATELKIPYLLIIGGREAEAKTVSVRAQGKGDLGSQSLEDFASTLAEQIAKRVG